MFLGWFCIIKFCKNKKYINIYRERYTDIDIYGSKRSDYQQMRCKEAVSPQYNGPT